MGRKKAAKPKLPEFTLNWQRKVRPSDKFPPWNFQGAQVSEDLLTVTLADNSTLSSGDFVYVVSKPGNPFMIARIMEFVRRDSDVKSENGDSAQEQDVGATHLARINWLYRPSSINKKAINTRELLLTVNSTTISLRSLRAKVTVMNRLEIDDLDEWITKPSCFWYARYWDSYIEKFFDVIPTSHITNIPPELGPIIRALYKDVLLEPQRAKFLVEAPQFCTECDVWCSEDDSVHCYICDKSYHRGCADPPIANPLKGYSWSCGPCFQAKEQEMEERWGPDLTMRRKRSPLSLEKKLLKEQKEAEKLAHQEEMERKLEAEYAELRKTLIPEAKNVEEVAAKYYSGISANNTRATQLWPFKYMGLNASYSDILDFDESVSPRAISRVGNKHQAVVGEWPGRPVVYYRKLPGRKRGKPGRGSRGGAKCASTKDSSSSETADTVDPNGPETSCTAASTPAADAPWIQEAPQGYIERGIDETSTLLWSPDWPGADKADEFLAKSKHYAEPIGVHPTCPNFIDACLYEFMQAKNEAKALQNIGMLSKKTLKEPDFSPEEVQRFEEAVAKYGNDLHQVYKEVKTKSTGEVVRFYYLWKKTEGGHRVWDNCQARLSRHNAGTENEKFAATIADKNDPELAYSVETLKSLGINVSCKFCATTTSREWRKAPNVLIEPESTDIAALCNRCARLWYRYAVQWMDPESVMELTRIKSNPRLRPDWEAIEDAKSILNEREKFMAKQALQKQEKPEKNPMPDDLEESAAKRSRLDNGDVEDADGEDDAEEEDEDDEDDEDESHDDGASETVKEEVKEEIKEEPVTSPVAVSPKHEVLDAFALSDSDPSDDDFVETEPNVCVVCSQYDPSMDHLICKICSVSVHAKCYGFVDEVDAKRPWLCDCCLNDRDNRASHVYQCDLCPVKLPNYSSWLQGDETGAPDALKRTWDGKWCHVRCAVWSPLVLFEHPECLQQVEIYPHVYSTCQICRNKGACIKCYKCDTDLHPGCAGNSGYSMGLLKIPSEKGLINWNGENCNLAPVIICDKHDEAETETAPDSLDIIPMSEIDETTQLTSLQLYCRNYKRAEHRRIKGALRLSLVHPSAAIESVLVIPQAYMECADIKFDVLNFCAPNNNVCVDCNARVSAYWVHYPDGGTKCNACYWRTDGAVAKVEPAKIYAKIDEMFDLATKIPRWGERSQSTAPVSEHSSASPAPAPMPSAGHVGTNGPANGPSGPPQIGTPSNIAIQAPTPQSTAPTPVSAAPPAVAPAPTHALNPAPGPSTQWQHAPHIQAAQPQYWQGPPAPSNQFNQHAHANHTPVPTPQPPAPGPGPQ